MLKYTFPNPAPGLLLYRGRRFRAYDLDPNVCSDEFGNEGNILVWDGLYDTALAIGTRESTGKIRGGLAFTPVEVEVGGNDWREFLKDCRSKQAQFFKDSGV
jgi:hypothetical protein